MLKHCGDVLDYHKKLIPQDMLNKYQRRNQSIGNDDVIIVSHTVVHRCITKIKIKSNTGYTVIEIYFLGYTILIN